MQPISQTAFTPQAIAQAPYAGNKTAHAPQTYFGNTEEAGPTDQTAQPEKKGFFATIREFAQQNGVVQGSRQFFGVLSDVFNWNKAFESANDKSSYAERLQNLFYLAFAEFCDGFQSNNEDLQDDGRKVKHALYANVLNVYPKLVLEKAENLPLDLVAKVTETSEDPAGTGELIETLKAQYEGKTDIAIDDLKKDLADILSV